MCENKLCRDPTSEKQNLYEFKIALFDNKKLGEFLLFGKNFKMALGELGTLVTNTQIQYLWTLLCGEARHKSDIFCAQAGSTAISNLNRVVLDLGIYIFPVNALSKKGA